MSDIEYIRLTKKQSRELAYFGALAIEAYQKGKPIALIAQVYTEIGNPMMQVILLSHKQARMIFKLAHSRRFAKAGDE